MAKMLESRYLEIMRGTESLTADIYVRIPACLESGLRLWATFVGRN